MTSVFGLSDNTCNVCFNTLYCNWFFFVVVVVFLHMYCI